MRQRPITLVDLAAHTAGLPRRPHGFLLRSLGHRRNPYSVEAVKSHPRVLFHKFGVDDLRENEKRLKLVDEAFRTGAISSTRRASSANQERPSRAAPSPATPGQPRDRVSGGARGSAPRRIRRLTRSPRTLSRRLLRTDPE